jgi:hypothetical protein
MKRTYKTKCTCNEKLPILKGYTLTHSKYGCSNIANPVSKLSTTFIHHETSIKAEVSEDTKRISLFTGTNSSRYGRSDDEFVFRDSKPETVRKVAEALLEILKCIK